MSTLEIVSIITILSGIVAIRLIGLYENYETGTLIGKIYSIKLTGLFFKSYRGRILLYDKQKEMNFSIYKWNDVLIEKINNSMIKDELIVLHYNKYLLSPIFISSRIVASNLKITEKNIPTVKRTYEQL